MQQCTCFIDGRLLRAVKALSTNYLYFVAVTDPKYSASDWIEGGNSDIHINSTVNCKLYSMIKIVWFHVSLENSINSFMATSAVLKLTSLSKNDSGKYYFQVLKVEDNAIIYTSSNTTTLYVSCKFFQ